MLKNKIKYYRALKGVTQAELAARIGVTRKTVNTIEKGRFIPSTVIAMRMARYFETTVEELFELMDVGERRFFIG